MYNLISVGGNLALAQSIGRHLQHEVLQPRDCVFHNQEILYKDSHGWKNTDNKPWIILFGIERKAMNASLLELLTILSYLQQKQAVILGLVCFYLPYCRQDVHGRNHDQPSVLQYLLAQLRQCHIQHFLVLDAHSEDIGASLPGMVHFLSMTELCCQDIVRRGVHKGAVVVSPDAGARKRGQRVAQALNLDHLCMEKLRQGNEISYLNMNCLRNIHDCPIIIVDDMVDQGKTLITLLEILDYKRRFHPIVSYVTHGVLSEPLPEVDLLVNDGSLVLSNSIDPVWNKYLDVSDVFVQAIRGLIK